MLGSFVIFNLTGCTEDGSATKVKQEVTVLDSQLRALEKTRQVGNVLQQSTDERQKDLGLE